MHADKTSKDTYTKDKQILLKKKIKVNNREDTQASTHECTHIHTHAHGGGKSLAEYFNYGDVFNYYLQISLCGLNFKTGF